MGKSGRAVPGEGNPDADIVFIGEAPGKNEAVVGRPFIGRSGKLLRKFITEVLGLKESDVFITSPVKYLPDLGTPSSSDIAHGKIHLEKQFKVIDPKIIVLLGRVAVEGVLGLKVAVKKDHGKIIEKDGRKYFITLHPAAVVRFAHNRKDFEQDFRGLASLLVHY
jgi:DNA polymerase